MGARAFSHSGLGAGLRGATSIWISSGADAMGRIYSTMPAGMIGRKDAPGGSERVQVRHQVGQLLLRDLLLKAGHLGTAEHDNFRHAVVIYRNAAGHVFLLIQPMHTGTAQIAGTVGVMTFGAAGVVHPPSHGLL